MTDALNPLWHRLSDRTQESYDLMAQRPQGIGVTESPDYHAHDAWNIRHLHAEGTVPHVHEMEVHAGNAILIPDPLTLLVRESETLGLYDDETSQTGRIQRGNDEQG